MAALQSVTKPWRISWGQQQGVLYPASRHFLLVVRAYALGVATALRAGSFYFISMPGSTADVMFDLLSEASRKASLCSFFCAEQPKAANRSICQGE